MLPNKEQLQLALVVFKGVIFDLEKEPKAIFEDKYRSLKLSVESKSRDEEEARKLAIILYGLELLIELNDK